ncbi:MAG: TlpA family protein disulfide reductase [Nitrospinae bacterium]|nr:TlpA family protein disulfide reductase [Nitrospinota bacterium]
MTETKEIQVNYFPFVLLATAFLSIYVWNFNRVDISTQSTNASQIEFPAENYRAPDFSLKDINGNKVTLSAYRGRVVFLNFWATWCVTCEEEMPSMEKLYQRFKDAPFEMLTVSVDKDGAKQVKPYLKKFGLTFPVLLDPDSAVAKLYKTTGVPETFIINKEGLIVHKAVGPRDWSKQTVMETFEKMTGSRRR